MIVRTLSLLVVAALLTAWPSAASAKNAKIAVDGDDAPLVISGFIGDADGFEGTMRLTAKGGVGAFRWLFSDLRTTSDPVTTIDRSHLSLVGATSMSDDDVIDVHVKVDGVREPGTYEGKVELIPAGQKRANAKTVQITVKATARPVLAPVSKRDKVSGSLTKCGPVGCYATGAAVPGDAGPRNQSIDFTLGKSQTAKVTSVKVFADGEKNGGQLSEDDLGLDQTYKSSAGVLTIPTTIDPSKLVADHYTGTVHLTVEDVDAPVAVPVDISVRSEPLLAIIALIVGLIGGFLWKFLRGDATKLLALYHRADLLERRVNDSTVADKGDLLRKIASARGQIEANDDAGAKTTLDDVESALTTAATAAPATRGRVTTATTTRGGPFYRSEGFLKFLSIAGGVVIALLLLITGFKAQYVDKDLTFGAGDFWDYFALAAWGFAAGFAGTTVGTSGGTAG